jgi:biopolymer transport protein ExbB
MEPQALGLTHFWAQADAINRSVGLLLLAMSVVSWTVVLGKLRTALALRGGAQGKLQQFWAAPALADGVAQLRALDPTGVFANLAQAAVAGNQAQTGMAGRGERADRLLRELRTALRASTARLDAGQTWLASIGATAPFVGLFGTVWGIYHALIGIASAGQVSIDRVAGPVGEALIMTALGLAVAIPSVLAYNAYARLARTVVADLDGFARDLHAYCIAHPDG